MASPVPIRVLRVSETPIQARLPDGWLADAPGVAWEHAETLAAASALLASRPADALLLDWEQPGEPAVQAIHALYRHAPHIPIVVMTGCDDELFGLQCIQAGAQDYLVRGQANRRTVSRALKYAVARSRTCHDITKQRRMEEALRASESRLRAIIESEPECVKLVSVDGRLLEMNPAGLRLIEADDGAQVLGQPIGRLIHPEDRAAFAELHQRASQGESRQLTFRITGLKGTTRWVETHSTPLRGESGAITAVLSVTRDITGRKQAEESLHRSKVFLQSTLDALTSHIAILDETGVILAVNEAWRRFGRDNGSQSGGNDVGANYLAITDAAASEETENAAEIAAALRNIVLGNITEAHVEYPCHSPFAERWFIAHISGFDDRGQRRVVIAHENISDQRFAEAALERQLKNIAALFTLSQDVSANLELENVYAAAHRAAASLMPGECFVISLVDEAKQEAEDVYLWDRDRLWAGERYPAGEDLVHYMVTTGKPLRVGYWGESHYRLTGATDFGYQDEPTLSVLAAPLLRAGGKPIGMMSIQSYMPGAYSAEHERLLVTLASHVASAIDNARLYEEAQRELFERKRAEARLQASEALLRVASRLGRLGGWAVEAQGQTMTWSDEVRAIHEAPPDFVCTVEEQISFFAPEHRDVLREAFLACMHDGVPFDLERQLVTMAGRRLWVRVMGEAVRDGAGETLRVQGACQDISERIAAEDLLRLQGAALGAAANAIVITTRDGTIEWANAAFTTLTGYQTAEAIGKKPGELVGSGLYDEAFYKTMWGTILAGEIWHNEIINRRKDGSFYTEEMTITPLKNDQGVISHFIAVKRDITTRKRAENALRESEERFRLLSKATSDAIWDWDLNTDMVWWSEGYETLFGYRRDEVKSPVTSWTNHIHPEDREWVVQGIYDVIEHGETGWQREYRFLRKDGSIAYVLDRGYVIRDAAGKAARMIGGMTDLTEQRSLEAQLRQSQKMEAIGQLAGGVAHDFNNLLMVILGYSDLLLAGHVTAGPMMNMVASIKDAGERAANLTRQLLAFSRKQLLAPQVLDLNDVVGNIEKMVRRLIGEDVVLTSVLQPNLSRIKVDPGQIEQVIINLAVNARDAMPAGGRLTIETADVEISDEQSRHKFDCRPGRYVALIMTDTGIGMTPEVKSRIFEPFFTTKEPGKGTGLGLATIFGIVKQSDGQIEVYSEVGGGAQFKILFPAVDGRPTSPTDAQGAPRAEGETILLVEDEQQVRQVARLALEAHGYHVLEAVNGRNAIDMIESGQHPIHLVITDVVMPEMGGRQLVEHLRHHHPGIKVLFISGYTDDAIVRHGIIEATDDFLQKPFSPVALARQVRNLLDRS
ncbi:MAG: PAS domain S-box protein [Caldilineaceae bacterium]|nr:PAS domain S-box protein [Caldilineaceae bacterium]